MRISDWSSDVCSSDLVAGHLCLVAVVVDDHRGRDEARGRRVGAEEVGLRTVLAGAEQVILEPGAGHGDAGAGDGDVELCRGGIFRSEEHTSGLSSLMRISSAAFGLTKQRRTYRSCT